MQVIASAKDILMASPKTAQLSRKKDPQAWSNAFNAAVKEVVEIEFADVRLGGLADPGPALSGYISTVSDLAALPVTKKLLQPLVQSGASIADPVATMRAGVAAVAKGQLTSAELVNGMSSIYGKAMLIHMQNARFYDFGIAPPNLGRTYNVKMPGTAFVPKTVNLADQTALGQWVSRELAAKNMGPAIGRVTSPFTMN
jgi:hypothetical protein